MAGLDWRIPPLPAADWIEAILTGSVVPDLFADETAALAGQLLTAERITSEELRDRSREAMADAAGRPWWEVVRLVGLLSQEPDGVGGELIRRGFDFQTRSIGAYCSVVYATAVGGMEKKERTKFDYQLSLPPVDVVADDDEAMSAAFMVAMQQRP